MRICHRRSYLKSQLSHYNSKMENREEEIDLRGCLKWTLNILKFAGYWLPRQNVTFSLIYSIPMIFCTIILYTCGEIAFLITVIGQLEEMANSLFLLLTHSAQILKIIIFISKKQKIYALLDTIQDDIFKPRNQRQLKRAVKAINGTNSMAKTFVGMVIATISLWSLFPLLDANNMTKQLPLRIWYPFDVTRSPQYEAGYVYQIFTVLLCGCANAAMDTTAAAFVSQICVQIDILSDSVLHIRESAEEQLGKNKERKWKDDSISPEVDVQMKAALRECVKHHWKLIR